MSLTLPQFQAFTASRHSVRAFTDQLVPLSLLSQVFETAQWAPSNCNTQPWRLWLVRGQRCEALRQRLLAAASGGEFYPQDFASVESFQGELRECQIDCARALYDAMGVARNDKPARLAAMLRNYCFFDAPQVLFIGMDKSLGYNNALDVGIYVQNLVLALHAAGLGSCVQGALSHHSPLLRQFMAIPESVGILTGISFGYPAEAPANQARTQRAGSDRFLTVCE